MKLSSLNSIVVLTLMVGMVFCAPTFSADPPKPKGVSGNGDLLYLKGKKSALDGDFRSAIKYFEKALKSDPKSPLILSQLSEAYLKTGNAERSIEYGKQAVEIEPKNVAYQTSLASVYAATKNYSDARDHYKIALKLNPNDRKIPMLLGIVEAELGNLDASVEVFSDFIKEHPNSETGYFYRARIFLEKDKIEKAKDDLDMALKIRPSFLEAGLTLGMLHERMGEVDKAIETYQRIDGSGRYKKRLAQLYLQKKQYKEALAQLEEYEKIEPDDYSASVKIGLIHFELKNYKAAAKKFNQILKVEPKSDNVRFYLAAVYEESKQFNKAIAQYKKVSPQSSFFTQSVLHVGFLLKDRKRLSEGTKFARRMVAKHPDVAEFYDMHAAFHEVRRNYKAALKVIQKGLKRHPKNEKLIYFEGAMYDKLGKREDGIKNMKRVLELNANNAHALNFLGYTYAEMGKNLDEAEELIKKALAIRPNDGFIEDSMGWLLFKKGKVDEALERLTKASSLQPEEAVIFDHLGDVYAHKKDYKKALEMYNKAVELSRKKDKEFASKVKRKLAKIEDKKRVPSNKK